MVKKSILENNVWRLILAEFFAEKFQIPKNMKHFDYTMKINEKKILVITLISLIQSLTFCYST